MNTNGLTNATSIGVNIFTLCAIVTGVFVLYNGLTDKFQDRINASNENKVAITTLGADLRSQISDLAKSVEQISEVFKRQQDEVSDRSMDLYTRADRYVECLRERDGKEELSCEKIMYTPPFTVNRTWLAFYEKQR